LGVISLTDGDWTISIPPGTVIPQDGLFTIGNNGAWGAGFFDLDAENCSCITTGTGGASILILTNTGEYVAFYDAQGNFIDGLMYGSPTFANTPPNGVSAVGGVIQTAGVPSCVNSLTIPDPGSFQTHPGGVAIGTSLIRSSDGTGAWTSQAGGSPNACNTPEPLNYTIEWSTGDLNTEIISSLPSGDYTATVTNNSSCQTVLSTTLIAPSSPEISGITNLCIGGSTLLTSNQSPAALNPWTSSNENVVTISSAGEVNAIGIGTATITFTSENNCQTSILFNVTEEITPTFNAVTPICAGENLAALPTTSNNGITGTWSPALDNTQTTTYTFTPDNGQCATQATLEIQVNSSVTPTFNAITPICAGENLAALPTTSNNGISGTWSPALDNTQTTTYTFTPDNGQCATQATLEIQVNSSVTPTFQRYNSNLCRREFSSSSHDFQQWRFRNMVTSFGQHTNNDLHIYTR
jgi:hypothetical protein